MRKKSDYLKQSINIVMEENVNWLLIMDIAKRYYHMNDEDWNNMPDGSKRIIYKQFKTYITHIRKKFKMMGELFMTRKNEKIYLYKKATAKKEDKPFIKAEVIKTYKKQARINNDLDLIIGNVKRFLPESEIEECKSFANMSNN